MEEKVKFDVSFSLPHCCILVHGYASDLPSSSTAANYSCITFIDKFMENGFPIVWDSWQHP
jgi:hypothetical protein